MKRTKKDKNTLFIYYIFMETRFDLKWSVNKQYYYNLIATNGETILNWETYTTKQNCINWINSVKLNSKISTNFVRMRWKYKNWEDYYFYHLKAGNTVVIWKSELYESISWMDNWIESVKRNASIAIINDLT